ncbi:MAG: ACT domain-containing protein, partial [Candidatus Riflebacteria bacterium]|nr:ACT domain-containing protein [Candidatus Riflebacteria bacterium]
IAVFLRELPDTADPAAGPGSPADAYLVRVMGADRPGIVFRVAEEMTRRRVNITDVETRVTGEDGTPVYVMLMEVAPPPGTDMGELESELARLSTELAVEISIRQIEYTAL